MKESCEAQSKISTNNVISIEIGCQFDEIHNEVEGSLFLSQCQ